MRAQDESKAHIHWFAWMVLACVCLVPGPAGSQAQVVTSRPCHFTPHASSVVDQACLLARVELGALPREPMYWYLDTFADRAAATAARTARGVVVEDYDTIWLFTIAGKRWQAKGARHVARIGPLPVTYASTFDAEYIHSLFSPGTASPVHKHSGPEAFYALSGDSCVEMPDGLHTATGPGNSLMMPGGEPMLLMATGSVTRRAFALVLHDATLPATTRVDQWKPAGLCAAGSAGQ